MKYFIQPSQPNRMIEFWDDPNTIDLFPDNASESIDNTITVYDYLKDNEWIGWDWSNVCESTFNNADQIFIYFSGSSIKRIGRICCLTEIQNIKYINERKRPLVAYKKKFSGLKIEFQNCFPMKN